MILIGVTGIVGSGKSTVSNLLREKGFQVIDLDKLAKESLSWDEVKDGIREAFGDDYVRDGVVDVEKLGRTVFSKEEELRRLEGIVHPKVTKALFRKAEELRKEGAKTLIIDAPLLFETDLCKRVDKIVVVTAPMEIIKERLKLRGMAEDDMERRIPFQVPLSEKEKMADYVVHNSGTVEDLGSEVDALLGRIKSWEVEVDAP